MDKSLPHAVAAAPVEADVSPTRAFSRVAAAQLGALGLLLTVAPTPLKPAGAGAILLYLAATALVALMMRAHYPHARLGLCNAVTHLRLALAAPLAAALAAPQSLADPAIAWALFGIAAACLTLDGADGWLARREGLSSRFGARFDVEVDAALALILSALAWRIDAAGPWVLWLGLPRYLFVGAQAALPWLRRPLPESRVRKAVCALQIGSLIALLCPAAPGSLVEAVAASAGVALAVSFAADVVWLARRARRAP